MEMKMRYLWAAAALCLLGFGQPAENAGLDSRAEAAGIYVEICPAATELTLEDGVTVIRMKSLRISEWGICVTYCLDGAEKGGTEGSLGCIEAVMSDASIVRAETAALAYNSDTGEIQLESSFTEPIDLTKTAAVKFGRLRLPLIYGHL